MCQQMNSASITQNTNVNRSTFRNSIAMFFEKFGMVKKARKSIIEQAGEKCKYIKI